MQSNIDTKSVYQGLLSSVEFPGFAEIEYIGCPPVVKYPEQAAYDAMMGCPSIGKIRSGDTVAITAGSREVRDAVAVLRGIIRAVKEKGGQPFVVPAMGSHGGATTEGQLMVLEHLGITEESIGAPIRASMETVKVGETKSGHPVHLDRIANGADHIIPIGRIKPHTDFRGPVESGVMKMLAIGLGKQHGAALCHRLGFPRMGGSVWEFGSVILDNCRVLLGMAIVENRLHETALIEAIPSEKIREREPELLNYAKSLMPVIPFDNLDVLLVSEIGKDISGAGMDTNITGRSLVLGEWWPHVEKIGVLDITNASDGNAAGIGNADVITKLLADKINTMPMYINSITCRDTAGVRIPTIMPTQELALRYMMYTLIRREDALENPRIVWIKNTADLRRILISEVLLDEAKSVEDYKIVSDVRPLLVDADGTLDFQR